MKIIKDKKIIALILSIVIVVIVLINSTYSLLTKTNETEEQSYTTGILDITSDKVGETITLNNAIPMDDSKGLTIEPYTFKIENTGNLTYTFDVKLLSTVTDNLIDTQYINLSIDGENVISLNSLTEGLLLDDVTLKPNEYIEMNLRVWLNKNTPNTQMGKVFNAKITTDGYAVYTDDVSNASITLDTYNLTWNEMDDIVSYEIYSNGELLTTTNENRLELYKYYDNPGTYDISVKAKLNNEVYKGIDEIVSYTIEQLTPYKPIDVYLEGYDDGFVANTEKLSNLSNSSFYTNERSIIECNLPITFNSMCNGVSTTNPILDPHAVDINICFNGGTRIFSLDHHQLYEEDYFKGGENGFNTCYEGPLSELSLTNNNRHQVIYDEETHDIHFIALSDNNVSFRMYFSAPGYLDSNIIFGSFTSTCLSGDMEVIVYDKKRKRRKKKKIKDVTYDDLLLVWDFDNACFAWAKPLWIKKKQTATCYNLLKFSDGSVLKTIEQHRIFNKEKGKFTYPMTEDTPIGTTTFNANGEYVKLISKEVIYEEVDFYNIITEYHINLFANNILTSCRLSNIYPIKDMKYIKDNRKLNNIENLNIDDYWIKGLRVKEQDLNINKDNNYVFSKDFEGYVRNLMDLDIKNK